MTKGSHLTDNEPSISSAQDENTDDPEKGIQTPAPEKFELKSQNGLSKDQTTNASSAADDETQAALERRQKERREREPLYYCKLITKYPLRCFRELPF